MTCLTRRQTVLAAGLLPLCPWPLRAGTEAIGETIAVTGSATLHHAGQVAALAPGMALAEGDRAATGAEGLAELMLYTQTRLNLGPGSDLVLEKYLADVGGTIQLGGALVFDRDAAAAKVDLTVQTAFGAIGVRGTRFFVGPSKGEYAVFCQRGAVEVTNAGVTRRLGPGDGVNLRAEAAPDEVAQWGEARIAAAFASVGLTP
jgi:hypothetical protein